MTVLLAILILTAPFAFAALLSRVAHRNDAARNALLKEFGGADYYRVLHDLDAVRTRFESNPAWPSSGVAGERR